MKKNYSIPEFELVKLSFENLLVDQVRDSKPEGSGFDGDDVLDE